MGSLRNFDELLINWLEEYLPNVLGRSENTIISYRKTWELFVSYLYEKKGIPADKISFDTFTFEEIMEFLDYISKERGCKASTRNLRRAAIVKFAEYAENYNFDAAFKFYTAAKKVPGKKEIDSIERNAMSKEQTKAILDSVELSDKYGFRDMTILNFLYASGARAQEVCNLRVKDIKFTENGKASIHFQGKGLKNRRIRISEKYASILRKYMIRERIINQSNHPVFFSQRNPQMSVVAIERIVSKYAKRVTENNPDLFNNIRITPHVFRHTTATHMLEAGVPILVVSRFLGHESIETTLVYAKLSEEDVNEKLKNWNRDYWGEYMDQPMDDEDDGLPDKERNLEKIFGRK